MTPNFSFLISTQNWCVQISVTSGGTISASHIFSLKLKIQVTMASKKNTLHKLTTKPARANFAVYLGASTNTDVPSHSYDTKSKTKALAKAHA